MALVCWSRACPATTVTDLALEGKLARPKTAKPSEIQSIVAAGLDRVGHALLSPRAPEAMQRRMAQLAYEYRLWMGLHTLRKTRSRKDLLELFRTAPATIGERCQGASLTERQLWLLEKFLEQVAQAISGKPVHLEPSLVSEAFRLLARLAEAKPPVARKLSAVFVVAFQRREEARSQGRNITAETLAQELMPSQYADNLESAVRSMQGGIARVERELMRCKALGIPFPAGERTTKKTREHQNEG